MRVTSPASGTGDASSRGGYDTSSCECQRRLRSFGITSLHDRTCVPSARAFSLPNISASHPYGTRGALAVPPNFGSGSVSVYPLYIRCRTLGYNGPARGDLLGFCVQPPARGGYSPGGLRWRLSVFDPHSLARSRRLLVPLDAFNFQRRGHYKWIASNCQPNGLCYNAFNLL